MNQGYLLVVSQRELERPLVIDPLPWHMTEPAADHGSWPAKSYIRVITLICSPIGLSILRDIAISRSIESPTGLTYLMH